MKTVSVIAPGRVAIIDTPKPEPGPYQALVRTELACLCNNTDGELVHGSFPGMEDAFPFALGHESVGTVEQIGDKVRNFSVGDRAVSGLVFDLGVESLQSGWGGFCEYVLANDHEAMGEDGVADEDHGWVEVFEVRLGWMQTSTRRMQCCFAPGGKCWARSGISTCAPAMTC